VHEAVTNWVLGSSIQHYFFGLEQAREHIRNNFMQVTSSRQFVELRSEYVKIFEV